MYKLINSKYCKVGIDFNIYNIIINDNDVETLDYDNDDSSYNDSCDEYSYDDNDNNGGIVIPSVVKDSTTNLNIIINNFDL